jgi:NAD(P)-dependent dehydrogenase (short-subunit alcohol dehydrogenase family)
MQKTIFITGSSSGLGKATAKLFQSRGWKVIATMRNPEKEKELNQLDNVILLPLDVTNSEQIKEAVKGAIALHDIDVVFNNAGYGISGALEGTTDEQIVQQLNTNLLGVIRVTKAFIPHFRQKRNGVFISTSSLGGLIGFPFSSLYHATKWGLEGWTESMSFELSKFGIQIKTVAPGAIETDFLNRSYVKASHPEYSKWMDGFFSKAEGVTFTPADKIAEVVYEAATDGKDQVRYIAGDDAKWMYTKRLELGNEAFRTFISETFLND